MKCPFSRVHFTRDELVMAFEKAYSSEEQYSKLTSSNISNFLKDAAEKPSGSKQGAATSNNRVLAERIIKGRKSKGQESEGQNSKDHKSKSETLFYIADLNGIDCVALYELKKAQEEHSIFPIPYIHTISPQNFMMEVNLLYIDYAKHMLSKVLTQRYLYTITTVSNQLVLFILNEDESTAFNKACKENSNGRFPQIELNEYETEFPLFKKPKTNAFLKPQKIRKLLLWIIKKPEKSDKGTFFEHFVEAEDEDEDET